MITLVRTHPADSVVAFFNFTDAGAGAALPVLTIPDGGPPSGRAWANLLEPEEPLVDQGTRVSLAPWGFAAYHIRPHLGVVKGAGR